MSSGAMARACSRRLASRSHSPWARSDGMRARFRGMPTECRLWPLSANRPRAAPSPIGYLREEYAVMRRAAKVGLLPFYLALYDSALPEARRAGERFVRQITDELGRLGLEVQPAPLCRLEAEFAAAVRGFEEAGVDAILTLHVAYSPSLESAPVLARTPLPIIVLDTTPAYAFGPDQSPEAIMENHGIHGVQDLCNMLLRLKRPFRVEAGHWEHSDLLHRVARWANAACLVSALRRARVGRIGRPFPGMGDFAVPPSACAPRLAWRPCPANRRRSGSASTRSPRKRWMPRWPGTWRRARRRTWPWAPIVKRCGRAWPYAGGSRARS